MDNDDDWEDGFRIRSMKIFDFKVEFWVRFSVESRVIALDPDIHYYKDCFPEKRKILKVNTNC